MICEDNITNTQTTIHYNTKHIQVSVVPTHYTPHMDEFLIKAHQRLVECFWSEIHIQKPGNCNTDYGGHFCNLNFPSNAITKRPGKGAISSTVRLAIWLDDKDYLPNGQPTLHDGSATFGLVLDKCNFIDKALDPPSSMTRKQKEFLSDLQVELVKHRREITKTKSQCLRINILKGADTIGHTDSFRSSLLPNFFVFFPPKHGSEWKSIDLNFCLRVRTWPNFKTSLVIFRGEVCIPFHY